jgi:uncharacterized protein (DUF2336 family)
MAPNPGWSGEATRVRLGAQTDATPEVLHALATDASVMVRASLALNPATPAETNAALASDADDRVRALLARKLSSLVPALSARGQEKLRQQTLDTLTALAEDEAVRVRAAIADEVKDLPEAPRSIILRLAHDAETLVCEPIIRFSPLLTTDDLVSLVAAAPSSGTAVAVARREAIDAAVSDAIASGGTDDAVLALLMNGSAQIREATLNALVERSIEHPDWHDPLIHRPALSDQSAKTLSRIVADHMLEMLAARSDLDPGVAADLRNRVSARMLRAPKVAEPAAPLTARPTEADLLAAARAGDARKAAVILAAAACVPLSVVRHAATLRHAKGLVSLAWKAGFSMQTGCVIQVLLAGLPPATVLKPGPGSSFPMSVQEMSWQVDFLSDKER